MICKKKFFNNEVDAISEGERLRVLLYGYDCNYRVWFDHEECVWVLSFSYYSSCD